MNSDLVDIDTRYGYRGGALRSTINCSLGCNPCGKRENTIDKSKSLECPRCGESET